MKLSWIILAVSIAVWVLRATVFALLGSYAPLAVLLFGFAVLAWGKFSVPSKMKFAVRFWGAMMLLAGLARVALAIGVSIMPEFSQHGLESLTPFYFAGTLFHLLAGLWLVLRPPGNLAGLQEEATASVG